MKKNKVFLIPNVTSAANIGDEAMLEVLISLIKQNHADAEIIVHSSEPHTHTQKEISKLMPTPYYWAVFENVTIFSRIYKMILLIGVVFALKIKNNFMLSLISKIEPTLGEIITDYNRANIVVFVGGGYLRSKPGITQHLNMIMLLLPFLLANFFKAKRVVAPISIGPFASNWHKQLTSRILHNYEFVAVREHFSYDLMKGKIKNLHLASDHALLLSKLKLPKVVTEKLQNIIGFTIRNWLSTEKQAQLESAYVTAITQITKNTQIFIQPIIQVNAPLFGEDDAAATQRVVIQLKKAGCLVKPTIQIKNVEHGKKIYGSLSILVGMRMHSNIFAGTQGTPFVPISYEYKTEGISIDFGLEKFCIKCDALITETLQKNIQTVFDRRKYLATEMQRRLSIIQNKEHKRWLQVLSK